MKAGSREFIKNIEFPFCYHAYLIDKEGSIDYFHYGLWTAETKNIKEAQENLARIMKSLIPKGVKRILDVGCGLGKTTVDLTMAGYETIGISPDTKLMEMAKTKYKDYTSHLIETSFEEYKTDKKFDLILFQESSQYIFDLDFLFAHSHKLLNKVGYILTCDEIRYIPEGPLHEKKNILSMAYKHNFKVVHNEDITEKIINTSIQASNFIIKNKDLIIKDFAPIRENVKEEIELLLQGWNMRTEMFEKKAFGYEIFLFSKNHHVLDKLITKLRLK